MSFIAVCDQCNKRQSYDFSHEQSLIRARFNGWLIESDKKLCGVCRFKLDEESDSIWDEIENVDGSDIDRVTVELMERGGTDAILGRFLRDKIAEYWATVDPVSCAND